MKAVIVKGFGGIDMLSYEESPMPNPGPDEVLIQTAAASVNFADIMARQGRYHGGGQPPFIPGLDVAGTVVKVGEGVQNIKPGQRVAGFVHAGSYAEYCAVKAVLTYPVPDAVDFDSAAAFPTVGVTAYELLTRVTQLRPGESVLVHAAAGGVGLAAVQMAHLLGAKTVIGTVGSAEKARVAVSYGADYAIDYQSGDFADKVLELTGGNGVDVILDSVSGQVFQESMRCLARFGRIAVFGMAGGQPGQFTTDGLHGSCRSVLGYSMGTHRRFRPEVLAEPVRKVLEYLEHGQLRMAIQARFSLKDAGLAQELVENRRSTGKVLLFP
ncbi:NADPH:quinone oxidoreductase family protein [Alicyclobacillus tolerans]|uniref:quinone oxidoreductase family protein n=1 Tax=Alicyclobacillus tolerans TaxID=90970 RepID=UPI001F3C8902|nr:NADPH:quinone oxidoreductase family protein [Alicyclobacillus tolerans]MCF8566340.1 NADPH:quinone oxidoreductase family protein [Alicyclobacillus tolerans]